MDYTSMHWPGWLSYPRQTLGGLVRKWVCSWDFSSSAGECAQNRRTSAQTWSRTLRGPSYTILNCRWKQLRTAREALNGFDTVMHNLVTQQHERRGMFYSYKTSNR